MNKNNYYYNFGYEIFGPLLYSFCKWLENECNNKKIKKLFFLSRDGYIIKKSFELLNTSSIKTEYFYASRRAINVPSLYKINNFKEIFEKITFGKTIKLKSFIKKVGIEDIDINNLIEKYNLDLETKYSREKIIKDKKIIDFMKELLPIIKNNAKKEFNALRKYLEKIEFNGNVAIVDIGWHGTMQKSLLEITKNVEINGYYMGIIPNEKKKNNNLYHGFLFDNKHGKINYQIIENFISIFEFLFLAQHGSVKRFIDNDDNVELYDYEYDNTKEKEIVILIQKGALKYINDNKSIENNKEYKIDRLKRIMLNPTYNDAVKFGDLIFMDNDINYIAKPRKLIFYITHPKKFKEDFIKSSWRIGFLKRLLKIKLPYHLIYRILKRKEK